MYSADLPGFHLYSGDVLGANDTMPRNTDPSTISFAGECSSAPPVFPMPNPRTAVRSPDNDESVSTHSVGSYSTGDQQWTRVDTGLIRTNNEPPIPGRFPVYLDGSLSPDPEIGATRFGYGTTGCVQKYETWIIETYTHPSHPSHFADRRGSERQCLTGIEREYPRGSSHERWVSHHDG